MPIIVLPSALSQPKELLSSKLNSLTSLFDYTGHIIESSKTMVTLKNNVVTVLVLIIGTFLLFNTVVEADIPVHCLHRQVVGTWIFRMGSNDHDDTLTCGHKLPDSVMTMVDNRIRFKNPNFKVSHDYKITLSEPNIATDAKGNKGTWTMIYDEGFEVRVNGKTFFSFFVYVPKVAEPTPDNNADFDSICTSSII